MPLKNLINKHNRKFLMGFAILIIYIHHLFYYTELNHPITRYWASLISYFFNHGIVGVDIFLFLSGYGLCHSFSKNRTSTFIKNRILRIYPFFIIYAILFSIIVLTHNPIQETLKLWALQFTGLSSINIFGYTKIAGWYVPALIILYLCFPILYYIIQKFYKRRWIILGLILFFVVGSTYFQLYINNLLAARIGIFILSIYTYFILEIDKNEKRLWTTFLICGVYIFATSNIVAQWSMLIPLLLLCFANIGFKETKFVKSIKWIGNFTLVIYLAQIITTNYLIGDLGAYYNPILLIIASIITTPILTYIIYLGGRIISNCVMKILNTSN